ncbi:MAG: DUF11 domain-containing protein [Thermoplasmata archaeon]|nr:MAG: DUF11 domain-containing protein [Thermoplasmata archaeon]
MKIKKIDKIGLSPKKWRGHHRKLSTVSVSFILLASMFTVVLMSMPASACHFDLSITKTAPAEVTVGDELVYTIKVSNFPGYGYDAENVKVKDILPDGVSYKSVDHAGLLWHSGNTYYFSLGKIRSGHSKTFQVTVEVLPSAADVITNTAIVYYWEGGDEWNPDNNEDSCDTVVLRPHMEVNKSVWNVTHWDDSVHSHIGDTVHFNISVHNTGSEDLININITDTFPPCLEYISGSAMPFEPVQWNSHLTWVLFPNSCDCGECDGKVTNLTLQYNGDYASLIRVEQKDGIIVFNDTVAPGGQFSFDGADDKGTLGVEISIFVDNALHTKIHTSCSQPIGPGLVSGDFLVIDGYSRNGGKLCPLPCVECGDETDEMLTYDEWAYIEFDALVVSCGTNVNTVDVSAVAKHSCTTIYGEDSATVYVVCGNFNPDIETKKTVWNNNDWGESTGANVGDTVRFNVSVHNTGNESLTNINITDYLPPCLQYAHNATVNDLSQEPTTVWGNNITWLLGDSLAPDGWLYIEFDATVIPEIELPPTPVTMVVINPGVQGPSYFDTTLSNVPEGYYVTNGSYVGWCVDLGNSIEKNHPHQATLYSSYDPYLAAKCPSAEDDDWDMVNYILNHKQGTWEDVQDAIWWYIGGGGMPSNPDAQAMVWDAYYNGEGFVPVPGEIMAVVCYVDDETQLTIIEVEVTPNHGTNINNVNATGTGVFSGETVYDEDDACVDKVELISSISIERK